MTLTLLLDLDDTLLINPFEPFLNAYLEAWGKYIGNRVSSKLFIKQLLSSTRDMSRNTNPQRTLQETFNSTFFPGIGIPQEDLKDDMDNFYREVFPEIRSVTTPRPEAMELVELAVEKGFKLGVATNPLFPRTAILQRLNWAGFREDNNPFEVISSYETFHFCKPHPEYYTEFLGQMGWPAEPVVMVGNSFSDDIQPAVSVGMNGYLLNNEDGQEPGHLDYTPRGTFGEVIQWLKQIDPAEIPSNYSSLKAVNAIILSTPAAILTLSGMMPRELWNVRPSEGEWSLTEIFCHLRDVDREVNLPRLETMISEDNPFIAGIDTDSWAENRQYFLQNGPDALQGFIEARTRLVDLIGGITATEWEKPLRHAIFGPSHLGEVIGFIAAHDRAHIQQIKQNLIILAPEAKRKK